MLLLMLSLGVYQRIKPLLPKSIFIPKEILPIKHKKSVIFIVSQKHFLCTISAPFYSYSALVIQLVWNVDRELRIAPPSHTRYFLSSGARTFTFIVLGASSANSFCSLELIPGNIVVPPLRITDSYKLFLMSTSD